MVVNPTRRRARTEARLAAKAVAAEPKQPRTQRTAEQRIADLEAQIEQVKRRAARGKGQAARSWSRGTPRRPCTAWQCRREQS